MSAKQKQKSLSKKEQRKSATEQANASRNLLKAAYSAGDLLSPFPAFQTYQKDDLKVRMEFAHAHALTKERLAWMLNLTRTNMEAMYRDVWGWSDEKKMRELTDNDSLFITAIDQVSQEPVGFLFFRFLLDDDREEEDKEVLYVYELQLESKVQGHGLGRILMITAELIARKQNMKGVELTCFTANDKAIKFYTTQMKYNIDETSPSIATPEKGLKYEILSKFWDSK
eukprot:TRINITY_DN7465_c0_g1_i1.p1 TRINITY_DN7465_c0_g1~~TRINITY_DN7465_c0_g1_i1.p1  ORF type:complete len:227 (-),score=51.14 TRINITY_DN7465_c0_g1_i1:667-1347(-)